MDVLLRSDFLLAVGGRRQAAAALADGTWQRVLRGTYAPAGELDLTVRAGIAVEYDGRAVHEREDVFTRDRQRQNDLVRAGWTVLRATAVDLRVGCAYAIAVVSSALAVRTAA